MLWLFTKKQPKEDKRKDYEKLGMQVAALYDAINPDRAGLYRTAFLKGLVTGVGSIIGATLVIVVLAWFLSLLGHIPFVGPIFDNVGDTIQDSRDATQT